MSFMPAALQTTLLLVASNVFMTFAWYGHLKFTDRPLWMVVVVSWGIAFVEYCFAVPANRWGHTVYSAAELKTMQEVITLSVFALFSVLYLGERITLNHIVGFALIGRGMQLAIGLRNDVAAKVKGPADIKGMKFGVTAPGSQTQMLVTNWAAKGGLKATDIVAVGVGAGAVALAFGLDRRERAALGAPLGAWPISCRPRWSIVG